MITVSRLRYLFSYQPETGVFVRLVYRSPNAVAGSIAGTPDKDGFIQIQIDGRLYKGYRLAWLYMTGEWPDFPIEHIDGTRNDAWANLRRSPQSKKARARRCQFSKIHDLERLNDLPEYRVWKWMWHRCTSPSATGFKNYGGRGISVCDRWKSFDSFYVDMGPRPSSKYSIDRIDNDGNYEPGNCRWATGKQQHNNTRSILKIVFLGRTTTLEEALNLTDNVVTRAQAYRRLKAGWTVDRALTTAVRGGRAR